MRKALSGAKKTMLKMAIDHARNVCTFMTNPFGAAHAAAR
jgi:hypothetical protein